MVHSARDFFGNFCQFAYLAYCGYIAADKFYKFKQRK